MSEPEQTPSGATAARPAFPRMLVPLALILGIAAGVGLVLLRGSPGQTLPSGATAHAAGSGYLGTLTLPPRQAPPLELRNYLGQPVTLSQYRGKAVMVTFLYTHCPDICPLIASNLRAAVRELGPEASRVQLIAVSVDPRGDTPAAVAAFLRAHGLLGRMQYLLGSSAELGRTWAAWSVGSTREAGQPDQVAHSALVYGVAGSGRLTTIYPATFEPSEIVHDTPRLASH